MGRDVRHLNPVDIVIPLHSVVETMLPVHGHLRHPVLVPVQKSAITVHEFLHLRCGSIFNDCPEAVCHILCNRKFSCSGIGLGELDDVLHLGCPQKLMVDGDDVVLQVDVLDGESTEFGNSHSRVEKK